MVVPVALMGRVAMAVVNVIDVPLMWHGHVPTARPVLVRMPLMDCMLCRLALVHMPLVHPMDVGVVDVVDVVAVRKCDVAAAFSVNVRMIGVRVVLGCRGHINLPPG